MTHQFLIYAAAFRAPTPEGGVVASAALFHMNWLGPADAWTSSVVHDAKRVQTVLTSMFYDYDHKVRAWSHAERSQCRRLHVYTAGRKGRPRQFQNGG